MRAVIYSRVSTEQQAIKGLSIETQIANCQKYADAHGYEVVDIVIDAQTAKNTNRPGLQRILKMASAKKIEHIICWNIDRLTRSLADSIMMTNEFTKKKVTVHEAERNKARIATTSQAKLIQNMEMVIKEWQREDIGDKTRTILAGKREQGLRISGQAPFGFQFQDSKVVENPAEQKIIQRIHNLKCEGFSVRAIHARLRDEGIRNRKSKPIGVTEIWTILQKAA